MDSPAVVQNRGKKWKHGCKLHFGHFNNIFVNEKTPNNCAAEEIRHAT